MADGGNRGPAGGGSGWLSLSGAAAAVRNPVMAFNTFLGWLNAPEDFDLLKHAERVKGLVYSNPGLDGIIASYGAVAPGVQKLAIRRKDTGTQAMKARVTLVLRLAQYTRLYKAQAQRGPSTPSFITSKMNLMKDLFMYLAAEVEKQLVDAALQSALSGGALANSQAVEPEVGLFGGVGMRPVEMLPWQVREALNAFIALEPALAAQFNIVAGGGQQQRAEMPYFSFLADAETPDDVTAAIEGARVQLAVGDAPLSIGDAVQAIIAERRGLIFGEVEEGRLTAEGRSALGLGRAAGNARAALGLLTGNREPPAAAAGRAGGGGAAAERAGGDADAAAAILASISDRLGMEGERTGEESGSGASGGRNNRNRNRYNARNRSRYNDRNRGRGGGGYGGRLGGGSLRISRTFETELQEDSGWESGRFTIPRDGKYYLNKVNGTITDKYKGKDITDNFELVFEDGELVGIMNRDTGKGIGNYSGGAGRAGGGGGGRSGAGGGYGLFGGARKGSRSAHRRTRRRNHKTRRHNKKGRKGTRVARRRSTRRFH